MCAKCIEVHQISSAIRRKQKSRNIIEITDEA